MAPNDERKRDHQRPIPSGDLPLERHRLRREYHHHRNTRKADAERQLEALPDTRHLDPERRQLDLLARRPPRHVV